MEFLSCVEYIDSSTIRGWCFDKTHHIDNIILELFVNNKKISEEIVNISRVDLTDLYPNINMNHSGFKFILTDQILNEKSKISIKIKDSDYTLDIGIAFSVFENKCSKLNDPFQNTFIEKKSIIIKLPIPNWTEAKHWGEYHLALGLKKEFEKVGFTCLLQIVPEWYNMQVKDHDIVIVFRGLIPYNINKKQFNIMWNISNPEKIDNYEYNQYDLVLISSKKRVEELKPKLKVPIELMYQCTDIYNMKPAKKDFQYHHDLLFVGNSRMVFRESLEFLLPTNYELAVYGAHWESFIDHKYVKGIYIDNMDLHKYYSNASIVLNDHWKSMKDTGFISNRVFDVLACNGFLITDNVIGIEEVFGDALVIYNSEEDLKNKVDFYLANENERRKISKRGRNLVKDEHSYSNRVNQILKLCPF